MTNTNFLPVTAALLACGLLAGPAADSAPRGENFANLPMHFERAAGQDAGTFRARGRGYAVHVVPDAVNLRLRGGKEQGRTAQTGLRMRLVGASDDAKLAPEQQLPGRVNYLAGDNPDDWRQNLATYGRVRATEVYPGIDVVYYGNQQRLQYDFIVSPGADPAAINLAFDGVEQVRVSEAGDLLLATAGGELRQARPVIYQEIDGQRKPVDGGFEVLADNRVAFELGDYAADRPLVIDPVLSYAETIGGDSRADRIFDVAVDASGNIYVTGHTESTDLPVSDGAYQPTLNHDPNAYPPEYNWDAWVMKLDPTGSQVLFATYLGGSRDEWVEGLAVNDDGSVVIGGRTFSQDFPVTADALQPEFGNTSSGTTGSRGFIAQISNDGSDLQASTYFGGSGSYSGINDLARHDSGDIFVVGVSNSADFPLTPGALCQEAWPGAAPYFVSRVDLQQAQLVYSTYLSGNGDTTIRAIAVDRDGHAYLTGHGETDGMPGRDNVVYPQALPQGGAYVSKLRPDGSDVVYTRFLGIEEHKSTGQDIALHSDGSVYVVGESNSATFPVTPQAAQPVNPSPSEDLHSVFVSRVGPTGNNLIFQTHLGGSRDDRAGGIAVDDLGYSYVGGYTRSQDFPTTGDAEQPTFTEPSAVNPLSRDAFVTRLNPSGSRFVYSSYIGGSRSDYGQAVTIDDQGAVFVAGYTHSDDFPTTSGEEPPDWGKGHDGYLQVLRDFQSPDTPAPVP